MALPLVTVYSKDFCQQCKVVKQWFLSRDIPFTVENVYEPHAIALAKSNNIAAAPMTVIGSDAFSGLRLDRLMHYFPASSFPKLRELSLFDAEKLAPTPPLAQEAQEAQEAVAA